MEWLIIGFIIYVIVKGIASYGAEEEQKKEQDEEKSRQKAAEDYILASGDEEAIKQLMLMRANPSNYQKQFVQAANGGNSTMRTAFAVMGGFIAADLITTSMHMAALEEALAGASAEMDQALAEFDATGSFDFADMGDVETPDIDTDGAEEGLSDIIDKLFS